MTTSIHSHAAQNSFNFALIFQAIKNRLRTWRAHRAGQRQLEHLNENLRRDIGLRDSGLTPAEQLRNFRSAHRAIAREHEIRFKIWN